MPLTIGTSRLNKRNLIEEIVFTACNAVPVITVTSPRSIRPSLESSGPRPSTADTTSTYSSIYSNNTLIDSFELPFEDEPSLKSVPQLAILPQYTTTSSAILNITKTRSPKCSPVFTVTSGWSSIPELSIHRPPFSHKLVITDTLTSTPLLTIHQLHKHNNLVKYTLSDPEESIVANVQVIPGKIFSSPKVECTFTSACTGKGVRLTMEESRSNKKDAGITIEDEATGTVLASMNSEAFTFTRKSEESRMFQVQVATGTDVVLVAAMVVAMESATEGKRSWRPSFFHSSRLK